MTYQPDFTLPSEILEEVAEHGFDFLPELIRIIFNTAMQAEREKFLGAAPYQRSPERRGQANGFKPKTVKTRVGEVQFDIPQVRDGDFYPSARVTRLSQSAVGRVGALATPQAHRRAIDRWRVGGCADHGADLWLVGAMALSRIGRRLHCQNRGE